MSKRNVAQPTAESLSHSKTRTSAKHVSSKPSSFLRTNESINDSLFAATEKDKFPEVLNYEEEGEGSIFVPKCWPILSRTSMLIMDYRHFLAAQIIQKYFRRWYFRRLYLRKRAAAIVIQTEWRRFYAKRRFYRILEEKVDEEIWKHYHRCATKIQALFRGWLVRTNVHDHYKLERMQMRDAETLLKCVAFKLHHLLRTHQIPGIYSLRNSNCLSKVEQLLTSLSFKQHNDKVRRLRIQKTAETAEVRKIHEKSWCATNIPFTGPAIYGPCNPRCVELFSSVDCDKKIMKILSLYETAQKAESIIKRKSQIRDPYDVGRKKCKYKKDPTFCDDVVNSMKRWNILSPDLEIKPAIFRDPKRVEGFLTEIASIHDLMTAATHPCHCRLNLKNRHLCM